MVNSDGNPSEFYQVSIVRISFQNESINRERFLSLVYIITVKSPFYLTGNPVNVNWGNWGGNPHDVYTTIDDNINASLYLFCGNFHANSVIIETPFTKISSHVSSIITYR